MCVCDSYPSLDVWRSVCVTVFPVLCVALRLVVMMMMMMMMMMMLVMLMMCYRSCGDVWGHKDPGELGSVIFLRHSSSLHHLEEDASHNFVKSCFKSKEGPTVTAT